jgi:putative flavoprotein involved in K+ transport
VLLGHLVGASGDVLQIAPDLHASLVKVDSLEAEMVRMIDAYIAEQSLDAPDESLPHLEDGYQVEEITEVSLRAAGVTTIIWAMGYAADYQFVRLPVFADDGYPEQVRGVTAQRGLYFMGLPWMHTRKSSLLMGVGEDAAHIASCIAGDG